MMNQKKTVLVTGANGFIGSRLIAQLAESGFNVIALSRKDIDFSDGKVVFGDFSNLEDLRQLDNLGIDVVVHLAGVTGAADEESCMTVNVAGTSRFMRYMIDLGVKKYVIASSIAVVGCLTADFIPDSLPIADDHRCNSSNVYGLSKYFVEETSKYFQKLEPSIDVTLFRIGVVLAEQAIPADREKIESMWRPFCTLGCISIHDVLQAFTLAAGLEVKPSLEIMNLVSDTVYSTIPTKDALSLALGDRAEALDLSHYEIPGNEYAGIYQTTKVERALDFKAQIDLRTMKPVSGDIK
jgi:nucleoside-diphosphate-sugar epimerase